MTKVFKITAILLSTSIAQAYIVEEGGGGRKASPFSTTDWSPESFAPKIRIRPLGENVCREDKRNVDSDTDKIIRREYNAWAVRYGKTKDMKRFVIFKKNFVLQMEMNRKNGEFLLLNEFGDMTEEEYIEFSKTSEERKEVEGNVIGAIKLEGIKNALLESKRKSILQETQIFVEQKKVLSESAIIYPSIQMEKCLPERIYMLLVDSIGRTILHEKESVRSESTNTAFVESIPFDKSYRDHLYTPMQRPDDFILRPPLLSAAVSLASETIRNHLIDTEGLRWEDYTDTMNFKETEYFDE
mmetsp:Transcript_13804/g.32216  ORF Transcript_13804/g.32216 Transcript_13804/m.32216 type:complete len:299 (+) Transcript_13804:93-989(+)